MLFEKSSWEKFYDYKSALRCSKRFTKELREYIDSEAASNPGRDFLDVGCGSGILSIAAALSGFRPVRGFDVDPEAVDSARDNAALNNLRIDFHEGDLSRGGEAPADVVAANVLGPILIRFAPQIAALAKPVAGARLILSGILEDLYPEVRAAYGREGFEEVSSRQIGEWRTGLFKPKAVP